MGAEAGELSSDGHRELCLECGEPLSGKFCSRCGAKNRPPLRPLHHWLQDLGRQVAILDIRLLRTLPRLFFSPGRLTVEYAAGRRQPYTSPIRLYVAASAVVLAAMSFLGVTDLDALLANSTEENIEALEEALGTDLRDPAFQARFNRRLDTIYPIVNLLSPPIMMLLLKLLYWRRYLQEHLAFGCHYGTFLAVIGTPMLTAEGCRAPDRYRRGGSRFAPLPAGGDAPGVRWRLGRSDRALRRLHARIHGNPHRSVHADDRDRRCNELT